jgi:type II secretory pathway pseudopilin PulG
MKKRPEEGMTLIEVILGITISALILAILFSALRLGHRSQEKGLAKEDFAQRTRVLGDRISWLIRGAYPYSVNRPEGKVIYFSGEPDSLGFVTSSVDNSTGEPQDMAGLKWVKIFVDEEGLKVQEKIYFSEDVFEEGNGKEYVLEPTVRNLKFQYLDVEEKEGIESWVTEWNPEGKDYLPSAVRVSITLKEGEKEIQIPPIIAAIRANQRPVLQDTGHGEGGGPLQDSDDS